LAGFLNAKIIILNPASAAIKIFGGNKSRIVLRTVRMAVSKKAMRPLRKWLGKEKAGGFKRNKS